MKHYIFFLVFVVAAAFALDIATFRANDYPISVCTVKSFIERDFIAPQEGSLLLAQGKNYKIHAKVQNSELKALAIVYKSAKIIYDHGKVRQFNNLVSVAGVSKQKIRVRQSFGNTLVEFLSDDFVVKVAGSISKISISVPSSAVFGVTGVCKALDQIKTRKVGETTFPNAPDFKVPIFVMNDDADSFKVPTTRISSKAPPREVDVAVIGGGLAGLTAASFLSDFQEVLVTVLEKESFVGGLAAGTHNEYGRSYSRGAAYFTKPFKSERLIMSYMGIVPYDPQNITEPIDSYYNPPNAKPTAEEARKSYFSEIWGEESLKRLHVSFRIFALEMRSKHMDKLIANQPIERMYTHSDDYSSLLDTLTAKQWVSSLPCDMFERKVPGITPLLKELEATEGKFDCKNKYNDPRMKPLMDLLNLYSRSALGLHTDYINAESFANFYWAELQPRYTTPVGTQFAVNTIMQRLEKRPNVKVNTNSLVISIEQLLDEDKNQQYNRIVYVTTENGKAIEHVIESDYVVYAAQLGFAPSIIKGFAKHRPQQAKLMSELEHVHYLVNEVTVEGHPWRATYDLWVNSHGYTTKDPSDIINGRWMELGAYEKYRDFKVDPPGDGIITVYHPMPYEMAKKPLNYEETLKWVKYSISRAMSTLQPLATALNPLKNDKSNIKIKSITSSRWPYSIHWTKVHHFRNSMIMKRKYGTIYFGSSSLGTPAFEEAFYRGYQSAMNILIKLDLLQEGLFEKYIYNDDEN